MVAYQFQKKNFLLVVVVLLLSACRLPQGAAAPTQGPGAVYTAAAQTVSAHLTVAASGTPQSALSETISPTQTSVPLYTPTPTDASEPIFGTPIGSPTPTLIFPNHMTFVKDVTYPDNTKVSPGEIFTKTWRVKNTGSNTWTSDYDLVFESGNSMGASAVVEFIEDDVKPGETVDISVELTAPDVPGTYQGFWLLRNAEEELFGGGNDSEQTFWVKIIVEIGTGVMFNFNAYADEATWGTGATPVDFSGPGTDSLIFGPPATPGDPFADLRNNQKLENGRVSEWILETYPPVGVGNYIIGKYPSYTVNAGDHLLGEVGLITNPDESCGAGDVKFQVSYTLDDDLDSLETLWEWADVCDGTVKKIEVNLSDFAGEEIQFYLVVITHTSTDENYAFWDSLAVQR